MNLQRNVTKPLSLEISKELGSSTSGWCQLNALLMRQLLGLECEACKGYTRGINQRGIQKSVTIPFGGLNFSSCLALVPPYTS
jgi:hypothetical protein